MDLVTRPYSKEEDLENILSLFNLVFHKKISKAFWKWRFENSPWGTGIISVAYDIKELAAFYAVMPINLLIRNHIINSVFSMTTMTHPKYRGRGLFPKLAKMVYLNSLKSGKKLVIGFPNDMSYGGFVKKLNWTGLGKVPICSFNKFSQLDGLTAYIHSNLEIKSEPKRISDIENLWKIVADTPLVTVPRNSDFLKWRFIDNPEEDYEIFYLYHNDKCLGYFVLKVYQNQQKTLLGHLIDFLVTDLQYFIDIFYYTSNYLVEKGVDILTFWLNNKILCNKKIKNIKELIDYNKMERTYFGYKIISNLFHEVRNEFLSDFSNWNLRMADSDVF